MRGPVGSDADQVQAAQVFDFKFWRSCGDSYDAASEQIDGVEVFANNFAGARGGKEVGQSGSGLIFGGQAFTGSAGEDRQTLYAKITVR